MHSKPTNPKDSVAVDKAALHLVSPIVKQYLAIALFLGATKYGAFNYRGAPVAASIYIAALFRHMDAWLEGQEDDPTDGTPHLANALACIAIIIDAKHMGTLIDDRPPSNADEYTRVRATFEALMGRLRDKYAHLDPHHYSIADDLQASPCDAARWAAIVEALPK